MGYISYRTFEGNDYMELTTPALLFPAISLLMLAYTNRFIVLAQLIRDLYAKYKEHPDEVTKGQMYNLKKNLHYKNMQIFGALSFLLCYVHVLAF